MLRKLEKRIIRDFEKYSKKELKTGCGLQD